MNHNSQYVHGITHLQREIDYYKACIEMATFTTLARIDADLLTANDPVVVARLSQERQEFIDGIEGIKEKIRNIALEIARRQGANKAGIPW